MGQLCQARYANRLIGQQWHDGVAFCILRCHRIDLRDFIQCTLAQQARLRVRRDQAIVDNPGPRLDAGAVTIRTLVWAVSCNCIIGVVKRACVSAICRATSR